jgi:hypothetical protein
VAKSRVRGSEYLTTTTIIIRDTNYRQSIDMGRVMPMVIGMSTLEEFNLVISLRRPIDYTKVIEVD